MSAYPPSCFGGWAKARFGGPSSVLPAHRLVDRPLGIMDDGQQLRLCQHLAGNLLVEQAVKSEKLADRLLRECGLPKLTLEHSSVASQRHIVTYRRFSSPKDYGELSRQVSGKAMARSRVVRTVLVGTQPGSIAASARLWSQLRRRSAVHLA